MAEDSIDSDEYCHLHHSHPTSIPIMQIPLVLAITALLGVMAYPGNANTVSTAPMLLGNFVVY
jgi:hypothetical protein